MRELVKSSIAEHLKALSVFQDPKITELSEGWTNQNYLIEEDGIKYVLRVPGLGTELHIDRESEKFNGMVAASLKISPRTFVFDKVGLVLREYLEGDFVKSWNRERLTKLVEILKILHNSPQKFRNELNYIDEIRKYVALSASRIELPKIYQELDLIMDEINTRLSKFKFEKVPCHNDLNHHNILENSEGDMFILDYEYASNGDPAWDVAYFVCDRRFDQETEMFFVNSYSKDPEFFERYRLYKVLVEIIFAAWSRMQIALKNLKIPAEEMLSREAGATKTALGFWAEIEKK